MQHPAVQTGFAAASSSPMRSCSPPPVGSPTAMRRLDAMAIGSPWSAASSGGPASPQAHAEPVAAGAFAAPAIAFPSPFHAHSFAAARSGGSAVASTVGGAPAHAHSADCGCDSGASSGPDQPHQVVSIGASGTDGDHHAPPPKDAAAPQWSLQTLLAHNAAFVTNKQYEPFLTDRYPYKKLVVVTCMDTRLTELLPMALDLRNGDAKIIKVAGAMVAHPFGSVMRSILVAVYALGAEHILVVGHHDCGMTGMDPGKIMAQAKARGVPDETFRTLNAAGLNLESWLSGFASVQSSVLHSVDTIRNHPLLSFKHKKPGVPRITVTGLVICPVTGRLDLLTPADDLSRGLLDQIKAGKQ